MQLAGMKIPRLGHRRRHILEVLLRKQFILLQMGAPRPVVVLTNTTLIKLEEPLLVRMVQARGTTLTLPLRPTAILTTAVALPLPEHPTIHTSPTIIMLCLPPRAVK